MAEQREAKEFLSKPNVAVLATVDAMMRAHATPIWYLYEDGEIIISTDRGSQKHRNVEAHPEITVVADERTPPYYAVMARGRAEIGAALTDEQRLALATRYLGEKMGRAYVEGRSAGESITIRLRPRKLIEYRGAAGR